MHSAWGLPWRTPIITVISYNWCRIQWHADCVGHSSVHQYDTSVALAPSFLPDVIQGAAYYLWVLHSTGPDYLCLFLMAAPFPTILFRVHMLQVPPLVYWFQMGTQKFAFLKAARTLWDLLSLMIWHPFNLLERHQDLALNTGTGWLPMDGFGAHECGFLFLWFVL